MAKRVFYNVHTAIDIGNHRLIVMQNVSLVDGDDIPENLKLQLDDVGGNQQVLDKILGAFKVNNELLFLIYSQDELTPQNGMFITSYKRFLEYFDYGYINWKANTPLSTQISNLQPGFEQFLFNNCYALHRKDRFVVSTNFEFASLSNLEN